MPRDSSDLDFGATIRAFAPEQRVFSRFVLKRLLGRGGMGVVWLAEDEKLEREVALKFLPEAVALDPRSVDDLKRETRRSLELTHPNIVRIYDFFEDDMAAAISMECVEGGSLAKLAVEQPLRCFEPAQILPWIRQLVDALEYAHNKAKIVHRDLKPANLMVTSEGDLKITDFGISATVTDSMTRVSRLASSGATPAYSSPQQVLGERPQPADDIYSLGATIFDLVTGKPPFHSGNLLVQVQTKPPDTMAERRREMEVNGGEIPESWERTVAACLQKDQALRPASPLAVLRALEGGELVLAGANGSRTRSKKAAAAAAAPAGAIADPAQTVPAPVTGGADAAQPTPSTVPPSGGDTGGTPPPGPKKPSGGIGDTLKRIITGREGRGAQIAALMVPVMLLVLLVALVVWSNRDPDIAFNQPHDQRAQPPATDSPGAQQPSAGGADTRQPAHQQQPSAPATSAQPPPAQNSFPSGGAAQDSFAGQSAPRTSPPASSVPSGAGQAATGAGLTDTDRQAQAAPPVVRPSAAPPPMPSTGSVEITSTPSGASVIAEGREIGRTPLAIPRVAPGDVEYLVRLDGYQDTPIKGRVVAGKNVRLDTFLREAPKQAASGREITVPDLNLRLVWVEPGEFVMGSPESESGPDSDEQPQTRVRFTRGFWVGVTEVTQGQFRRVMGRNPSRHKEVGENGPVENVSWEDAAAFCARVNRRESDAGRVPDGYAYQLPTEAQWEYACRAGTSGPYAGEVVQMGVVGRKASGTGTVASKRPNRWGIYDMHGNVSEWTRSWYGPYPGGTVEDYAGPASGKVRVFRGGAYNSSARSVRSAYRGWVSGSGEDESRGFRVVLAPVN